MKTNFSVSGGYSLIEVLVAVAILMFSIVGPMTIAAKSIQSAQYAKQQTTAFFLAQEGISLTENIRNFMALRAYSGPDDPWGAWVNYALVAPCRTAAGCNFGLNDEGGVGANADGSSNTVVACTIALPDVCTMYYDASNLTGPVQPYHTRAGASDPQSIYKRTITWTIINADEMLVTSKVEWNSTLLGGTQIITISTSLFNKYKNL
jgi:type II secretory pathway pseudopilin PulG